MGICDATPVIANGGVSDPMLSLLDSMMGGWYIEPDGSCMCCNVCAWVDMVVLGEWQGWILSVKDMSLKTKNKRDSMKDSLFQSDLS
jgi:hypothetical protein